MSPYKSRQKLWREKKGRERPVEITPAMQWGIDHEADALLAFAMETGELPSASGLVIHPEHPWLGCSPDADTGEVLVECKCPYNGQLHREIPEHYMAQIQGQLEIVGRERCAFVSWTPEETNIIWVERSREYWGQMFPELQAFWRFVVDDVEPPRRRKGK